MHGKVCLVTGASGSIGGATARELARRGATVIAAGRNATHLEQLAHESRTAEGSIEPLALDLADAGSVRRAAAEAAARHGRLDALVHCAAVFTPSRRQTADGLELMFATNHLGPFLLTQQLLDLLRGSAPSRVVVVSAPVTTPPDFDDLQHERRFRALEAFGRSKMCNLLFTFELARRLAGSGVTANAAHPGIVRSELMRGGPWLVAWLGSRLAPPPERAGAAIADLAVAPAYADVSGGFFKDGRQISAHRFARDPAAQRRLWDVSSQLVARIPAGT